jgi:ankyrin repeat protein
MEMAILILYFSEIWSEYLQNIIERIEPLNLGFCLDKFDKSPIHYAAKHGQIKLLKYLLSMKNCRLNVFDKDGNSELDYAVESGNPEIIQVSCRNISNYNKSIYLYWTLVIA